jgi:6,7-dimethyl-8-ribityllumazine synthase
VLKIVATSLKVHGLVHVSVVETEEALDLPYLVQALIGTCDGIIACAIVTADAASVGSLCQTLTGSLLHVGVTSSVPVIPGIVGAKSLLEAKVLFQDKANGLAKSLASILKMKTNPKTITVTAPPVVGEVYKPVEIEKQTTPDGLIFALRQSLKEHGTNGIFGIARKFRIIDDDNSKSIDLDEFKKAINEHAMNWTAEQIKTVFDFFDRDKSGSISYEEFLRGVREPMNARRQQFVFQAFQVLGLEKFHFEI